MISSHGVFFVVLFFHELCVCYCAIVSPPGPSCCLFHWTQAEGMFYALVGCSDWPFFFVWVVRPILCFV